MNAAHTPGPWHVVEGPSSRTPFYVDCDEHTVATVNFDPMLMDDDGRDEANASLIAAAPDLLHALRRMVKAHDDLSADTDGETPRADPGCIECTVGTVPNDRNTGLCAYHNASRVIRKAEGRS